MTAEKSHH
ncbi:hypothetical protein CP8484711_1326A, partial [Chlamydia psittaci 84-8471/1]